MEKRSRTKTKKFTYKMQANLLLAFGAIVVMLVVLIIIMIKINVKDGNKYAKKVLSQQSYTSSEIAFKRGDILDRNKIVMATSIKVYNLVLDPKFILTKTNGAYQYKDYVVDVLTQYFDYDKEELYSLLEKEKGKQYYILKKKVSSEDVDGYEKFLEKFLKNNKKAVVKGVWFEEEYERKYPLNSIASSVVGFTYDKNAGNWGIEEKYNSVLNGSTGRSYGYYDSELNLERTIKDPVNGQSVVSTIDSNIQRIVEQHIKKFQKEVGSKNTAVMIADPDTGEILAMASSNGIYNLNEPRKPLEDAFSASEIEKMTSKERTDFLSAIWGNYCISGSFEPGSTFKPFVVAAGLEEGLYKGNEKFVCDGKEVVVEGTRPIRCAKREGHGTITLEQALMFSCNDAMMAIGKKIGKYTFVKYQKQFGFGYNTGIDLYGENKGIVYTASQLNPLELATSSFGQGINVTMVQMVSAFSSLVNGGYYYEPHIVKQILNENGAVVKDVDPVLIKETVTKKNSQKLIQYMKATVEEGTAKYAKVEGYSIGGKTGTAQKLPRSEGKYLVSFLGFAPCEDPQFVIYSIVDEPDSADQAQSKYAQELAAGIMADIFPFMEIFPSDGTEVSYYNQDKKEEESVTPTTKPDDSEKEDPLPTINPNAASEEDNEYDIIDEEVEEDIGSQSGTKEPLPTESAAGNVTE